MKSSPQTSLESKPPAGPRATNPYPVVIVGAGFGGLCMGVRLKEAGVADFAILEASSDLGGTWRDNHYPGAACDVESHLYSFSFEPNPNWKRSFASQAEILAYLDHCADKFRLRPHIRLGTRVDRASFDESAGIWSLETKGGDAWHARAIVLACGGLSRPAYPRIAGLDTFEGRTFHSARWDHSFALEGKNVAVIGTGASAIQIVPSIAAKVARLTVFQRTPPWILPKADHPIRSVSHALYRRVPLLQRLARFAIYWKLEALAVGFVFRPALLKVAEYVARRYLAKSVPDPVLRGKLLPSYAMGCKRILPTNDYYPALARSNVELVTERIDEVRPRSIATVDGRDRRVDVIVLATGFQASEQVAPFEIVGRSGRRLDEVWRGGAEAYLGTTVSGFPNLFFIIGPNTGLGHSSMIFMIESQCRYVVSSLCAMRDSGIDVLEVRPDAQRRYNERLNERLRKTVWASGCKSWYLTAEGKNTTLWPGFTFEFRMQTRRFDAGSYDLRRQGDDPPAERAPSAS